jgi:hypothetical protein
MVSFQKSNFPLYTGETHISECIGNNRFHFGERRQPCIVVPALIEGEIEDVECGDRVAIECDVDGTIVTGYGLVNFVSLRETSIPVYIFDNHNHAYTFWSYHVDQMDISA